MNWLRLILTYGGTILMGTLVQILCMSTYDSLYRICIIISIQSGESYDEPNWGEHYFLFSYQVNGWGRTKCGSHRLKPKLSRVARVLRVGAGNRHVGFPVTQETYGAGRLFRCIRSWNRGDEKRGERRNLSLLFSVTTPSLQNTKKGNKKTTSSCICRTYNCKRKC